MGKKSTFSQGGKVLRTDYTYKRYDGKTESRHVNRYGGYIGRTVSDKHGKSEHYNRYGRKTS